MVTLRWVMICGSAQPRSANAAALDVVRRALDGIGGVDIVDLVSGAELVAIPGFDAPSVDDPPVAVANLRARIECADAVLIAAPEYAGGVAGTVKNALDWIVGSGSFDGRVVAVISAGTTGGVNARHDVIRTLNWHGAHVVADLGIAAPSTTTDASGCFTDPGTIAALHDLAVGVRAAVRMTPAQRLALASDVASHATPADERVAPVLAAAVESAVLAANTAFYEAHERRDLQAMAAEWMHGPAVVCIHPGWPILRGWPDVEESWRRILDGPGRNQFIVTNAVVTLAGRVALVTLDENLIGASSTATIAATNVFVDTAQGWKMIAHHGSPVGRM